jgi:hypothetical protein
VLTQPSSQLLSQMASKRTIADLLSYWCNRTDWQNNHRTYDLSVEFWATGLWVKQAGLVSYRDWANFIIYSANIRARMLQVQQLSKTVYLVQGSQQPWYAVHRVAGQQLKCECMLYRNRANRLQRELPVLFKKFNGKIFCHHTAAVESVRFIR